MESGDGGAEENNERPKGVEGQMDRNPSPETESDTLNNSENNSQQNLENSENIDNNDEEKLKLSGSDADNNLKQQTSDSNEHFSANNNAQDSSRGPEVQSKCLSDQESGEDVVFPAEPRSADLSLSEKSTTSKSTVKDDSGLLSLSELVVTARSDLGDDASAKDNTTEESSLIKDADGTVKESADSSAVVSAVTDDSQHVKDRSHDEVDEELENFFSSAQPEVGKFPALDNVDLASDEDGHEGAGGREGEENLVKADSGDSPNDLEEADFEAQVSTEKDGDDGSSAGDVKTSTRKDYPLNPNNYKVCRELEPGVKQCLILETGEEVVCKTDPKAPCDLSTPTLGNPFSSSSPRTTVIIKRNNGGTETETSTQMPVSEAFAYVSFKGGTKLNSEGDLPVNHQHFLLDKNQQAFITENGIPVILDNAEDDVKLGLQATMDRLGMSVRDSHSPPIGQTEDHGERVRVLENEPVADVLSSGGDCDSGSVHLNDPKQVKKSKRKKDKKQRFYELQPDTISDDVGEVEADAIPDTSNKCIHVYVGHQKDREGEGENVNNNAFDQDRVDDAVYGGVDSAARRLRYPIGNSFAHELSSRRFQTSDVLGSESLYSPSSRRTTFNDSCRQINARGENSYSRYKDRLPLDSSHLSTRFSRLDRGDPSQASNVEESLTIPRFRTLHDQQVSWLEMFKMIEDQHRTELQSQYSEHQQILQDMQQKMERELTKQQDTLKHRLQTHKEILQELSPRHREVGRNLTNSHRAQEAPYENASHTTVEGTSVTLKYPPPLNGRLGDSYEQVPVKRSLDKEMSSSTRPPDSTSLNLTETSISGDKLLRGGVYSSPMPLAKARQKKNKSGRAYENKSLNSVGDKAIHSSSISYEDHVPTSYTEERTQDTSLTESDDVTSPRSRVSLREKHAKHVADLRAYYEDELKEMRKLLTSRQTGDESSRESLAAGDRILANENAELRQRCQELDDECHDLKIEVRELQQKIQGLEIRATDYAERFNNSQSQVRSLHARLEELTEFAKEKETAMADMKTKHKTSGEAVQAAYKKEKELTDSLHAAKTTIQRLVEKYESLEKDQQLLKESLADKDEKLFASRKEAMDVNNQLSRMELENKQLIHDKDVLKHELTMARSSVASMHTCFEEAIQNTAASSSLRESRNTSGGFRSRSSERTSLRSSSRDRKLTHGDQYPDSETDTDFSKSPIIKAERELKKLRESVGNSQEFAPKLQRKFYGTETSHGPSGFRGSTTSSPGHTSSKTVKTPALKSSSPREKRGRNDNVNVNGVKSGKSGHSSAPAATQNRHDNISSKHRESERIMDSTERSVQGTLKRLGIENGWSSEQAVERIKAGDVVSRPAWEDVYTSMARPSGSGDKTNQTRDQLIRERLQNIDMMERKYDDLSNEKRKYESALSKVPSHGSRREKERLDAELDRVDRELGSVRMSLKRYHVLKSTI